MERYDSLNGLRTIACIGIVLMHIKENLIVKPSENFLTNSLIGYSGNLVYLFMMISAFSMCCGYLKKFQDRSIDIGFFYKRRYQRVLPFFALLVFIDVVVMFVKEPFFSSAMQAELCESFANLTLLFGLLPRADISVIGVGWFLGVIFVFYLLFPFFTSLMKSNFSAVFSFCISVIFYFIATGYFSNSSHPFPVESYNIIYCAPYFLMGGLLYKFSSKIVNLRWIEVLALLYTIFFFAFSEYRVALISNCFLFSLWICVAIREQKAKRKWTLLNNRGMTFVSGISMEVYLCHMLFFRLVEKVHLEMLIQDRNMLYFVVCTFVLLCAMSFSLMFKKAEQFIIAREK